MQLFYIFYLQLFIIVVIIKILYNTIVFSKLEVVMGSSIDSLNRVKSLSALQDFLGKVKLDHKSPHGGRKFQYMAEDSSNIVLNDIVRKAEFLYGQEIESFTADRLNSTKQCIEIVSTIKELNNQSMHETYSWVTSIRQFFGNMFFDKKIHLNNLEKQAKNELVRCLIADPDRIQTKADLMVNKEIVMEVAQSNMNVLIYTPELIKDAKFVDQVMKQIAGKGSLEQRKRAGDVLKFAPDSVKSKEFLLKWASSPFVDIAKYAGRFKDDKEAILELIKEYIKVNKDETYPDDNGYYRNHFVRRSAIDFLTQVDSKTLLLKDPLLLYKAGVLG